MCGIAGKISLGDALVTTRSVEEMTEAIAHRGPDDSGVYISPDHHVGLGFRRLAIIDLSPKGHQPMGYADRYWIVFNGEIYNYQSLRRDLQKQGYQFKSQSDTEVILALYDRYQEKCVLHLRGMFAFAIYDEQEKRLYCARDRVGKKPFKYYADDQVFLFGSELKTILTQTEYKKEIDYLAIHHYVTYQYCPAPYTGFKGIHKLAPAHYLILDQQTGKLTTQQYWHLDYSHKESHSEADWAEQIFAKLDESVQMRMIADVPVGAFLSGGIDSSAVVGLMSRHSSTPVKTFSIGFSDQKFNELDQARQVAQMFGCDHTEFTVEPKAIEVLPLLARHFEEPFADSSALPTYYVSKMTRSHVTVALNGDGGDENFAGYTRYSMIKAELLLARLGIVNKVITAPALAALSRIGANATLAKLRRLADGLQFSNSTRAAYDVSYFTNEQKSALYSDEFKARLGNDVDSYEIMARYFDDSGTTDPIDQALYADFMTYLPDCLLAKVDIATMAVSLEGRSPFLDHELLELGANIPSSLKLRGINNKKYILKKALRGFLPDDVLDRPKHGFSVPVDRWFREDLKSYAYDHLLGDHSTTSQFFNREQVQHLLDQHTSGQQQLGKQIWALLTLELWKREFFG